MGDFLRALPTWILVGIAASTVVYMPSLRDGGFFLPSSLRVESDGVTFRVMRDGGDFPEAVQRMATSALHRPATSSDSVQFSFPNCSSVPPQDLSPSARSPFVFRFPGLGQLPLSCYGVSVKALMLAVNANPAFQRDLQAVVLRSASSNIYGFPALQSLTDFYNFLQFDVANWIPMENMNLTHIVAGKSMYIRLCQHYYIFNQPEMVARLTPLAPHPAGQMTSLSIWMRTFANEWGAFLHDPASFPPQAWQAILESQAFHMEEYVVPNPQSPNGGFKSYNDWFARHVKPGERPIASPNDPSVIVTPCDSTFVGWWPIDEDGCVGLTDHNITNASATALGSSGNEPIAAGSLFAQFRQQRHRHKLSPRQRRGKAGKLESVAKSAATCFAKNKVVPSVKGLTYYSVQTLIRDAIAELPKELGLDTAFNGGTFMHMFLNVYDYHRLHLPMNGYLWYNNFTSENVYLNVTMIPESQDPYVPHEAAGQAGLSHTDSLAAFGVSDSEFNQVDAEDYTGYQFYQSRGVSIMNTPIGWVATLPMGMAQVSLVTPTASPGSFLGKGAEFSAFGMGGSDMVILFQKEANVNVFWERTAAGAFTHKLQGQAFATATPFNKDGVRSAAHLKKGRRTFRERHE